MHDVGFSFWGPPSGSYFYAYYRYKAPAYPPPYVHCPNDLRHEFAVLAFYQGESPSAANVARAVCGDTTVPCPEGGIPGVCRDWGTEFTYSVLFRERD